MPFTYLAHQAPAVALKARWPASLDGVALALGTMAPDWAYALAGSRFDFDGHSGPGLVLFCAPAAVVAAVALRRVAPVLFAYLPSPRLLPLRQLTALGPRQARGRAALSSALLGALTHVVWDLFTHDDRWGPRHIAVLRVTALHLAGHAVTWAKALQYLSHILGSIVALVLLSQLLRSAVDPVPPRPLRGTARFVVVTLVGAALGAWWALSGDAGTPAQVIRVSLGLAGGLAAASVACAGFAPTLSADRE